MSASPSQSQIRARRRLSYAAVSLRRNSTRRDYPDLSSLQLDSHGRKMTFCEEMVKSPMTPLVLRDAVIFQYDGHPKQAIIDGEIWPPIFQAEKVRSAKSLEPIETDVFVCTYPKCGTTWIQHICSQLMVDTYGPSEGKELCMTSPMIEKMGAEYCDSLTHPRLLKTHFTYANCPKSSTAKYIVAARNPKDCLTSYYFHNRNFKIYDWATGDFDVFFELFVSGQLAFGDYFDHLLSWVPHLNDENVLFLKYEDMFEDLEEAVLQIGNFLGGRAKEIVNTPEMLDRIVRESNIDAMKQNQSRWFPGNHLRQQTFIRKGGSRDWKNYMNKEQSDRIDAIFRTRTAGTPAATWWKYEMAWDEKKYASTPEIVFTTEEEEEEEESEEAETGEESESDEMPPSVSRRGSLYALMPYMPDRRNSMESVASSGYGSVWSGPTHRKAAAQA